MERLQRLTYLLLLFNNNLILIGNITLKSYPILALDLRLELRHRLRNRTEFLTLTGLDFSIYDSLGNSYIFTILDNLYGGVANIFAFLSILTPK